VLLKFLRFFLCILNILEFFSNSGAFIWVRAYALFLATEWGSEGFVGTGNIWRLSHLLALISRASVNNSKALPRYQGRSMKRG
jgi:hypothetical protein